MAYVRNADLTLGQVQRLVQRCGYEDLTSSVRGYVLVVRTPAEEIIGFSSFAAARRLLTSDLQRLRAGRLACGREG
jgi:hypothetical protein